MFQHTHTHLFNIAGAKDSSGYNALCVLSGAKAPWLYGAPLDKNDRPKAVEIVRRFRCTVTREILRGSDENGHRLRESSRDQSGIWKITGVDRQIEAVFDDRRRALRCCHLNRHVGVGIEKSRQL